MSWNNRLKKYIVWKKIRKADVLLVILLCTLLTFCFKFQMPVKEAIQSKTKISLGYCAKSISDNRFYVVDSGHERLICFDNNGHIRFSIEHLSDKKGEVSYIDDFAVTDKGIYISASQWEGMTLSREAILFFDNEGKYVKTVRNQDYSSTKTNKHRFYGISEQNGILQYAECLDDRIIIGNREVPYENAFNAVSDIVFVGTTAYVLDKDGTIREYLDGEKEGNVIFSQLKKERYEIVPYKLAADKEGRIYFTDIKNNEVRLVNPETKTSNTVEKSRGSLTVAISDTGKILLLDEEGLHVVDYNGEVVFSDLEKPMKEICFQIVWLMADIITIIIGFLILSRLIMILRWIKLSPSGILCFWVILAVCIVSIILCGLLMNSFAAKYRSKIVEQLECSAYMIANQVQPEDIEEIEETGGFGGSSYNRLCEIMEKSFSADIEFYDQIYCNILKLSPDRETGYAVAYLDQSIGSYFPLDEVETKELQKVYQTGKTVQNNEVEDISGTYLSVKVPIFNENGQVCGVVATGAEDYIIEDILQNLIRKIWLSIAIILMLVWLLSVEGFSFISNYGYYKKAREKKEESTAFPAHIIRLLIFLVFAAYNMTAAFLPVYLLRQSDIFTGKMKEIAGALPITVNIFLIGIMALFCARLVDKFGLRKIMAFAVGSSFVGNFVIYSFSGFYPAMVGLILDGIGVGLITNAVYVLVTYVKEEQDRAWGLRTYNSAYLSGINFGMMFGSILAVNVGQHKVFGIVAAVWLILLGLIWVMMHRGIPDLETARDNERKTETKSATLREFILNRSVSSFVVFIQNPYIIFGSFVFYYVPIFCNVNGLNETICSILIMLYSQVAVLSTDFLTKSVSKFCRNYGMYLSLAINIISFFVFSIMPGIKTMIIALILMGISSAFGKPVQQNYYLNLKSTKKYGDDKAMGIYNFTENIGESLGPIIFGRLSSSARFATSSTVFCGVIGFLMAVHYLISKKELKDEKKGK